MEELQVSKKKIKRIREKLLFAKLFADDQQLGEMERQMWIAWLKKIDDENMSANELEMYCLRSAKNALINFNQKINHTKKKNPYSDKPLKHLNVELLEQLLQADDNEAYDFTSKLAVEDDHSDIYAEEFLDNLGVPEKMKKVYLMYSNGYTQDEIAEEVGVSQKKVSRILNKFKKGKDV